MLSCPLLYLLNWVHLLILNYLVGLAAFALSCFERRWKVYSSKTLAVFCREMEITYG